MSSSRLMRWSGLALLIGGLLIAIATTFHPDDADPRALLMSSWGLVHATFTIGAVLSLFGLIAWYARQREQAGATGLLGFVLLFTGTALFIPILFAEALILPVIAADPAGQALLDPAGPLFGGALGLAFLLIGIIFALGCLVSAVATVRAGVLPGLASVLLVGGALLAFTPPLPHLIGIAGGALFGLGYAWLGYAIWMGRAEPARGSVAQQTT
jgi:hypothetical protein